MAVDEMRLGVEQRPTFITLLAIRNAKRSFDTASLTRRFVAVASTGRRVRIEQQIANTEAVHWKTFVDALFYEIERQLTAQIRFEDAQLRVAVDIGRE